MQDLKTGLKISLMKKGMNALCVGNFCIAIMTKFFENKFKITGNIKNWIFLLQAKPSYAKNIIFLKKSMVLEKVNDSLKSFGYNIVIKDIIIK